jgi:hypothetical protein
LSDREIDLEFPKFGFENFAVGHYTTFSGCGRLRRISK